MFAPGGTAATDRSGAVRVVPGWYERPLAGRCDRPHRWLMEQLPVAEILPGLYRSVLDAVGRLESLGRRRDAAEIRAAATAAYSKAWNGAAERRLQSLRARAERIEESRRRARPTALDSLPIGVDLEQTPV